jgi:hypothetical protein
MPVPVPVHPTLSAFVPLRHIPIYISQYPPIPASRSPHSHLNPHLSPFVSLLPLLLEALALCELQLFLFAPPSLTFIQTPNFF